MNLDRYFELPDWPMKNSPLGRAVQATAEKRPKFTAQQCLEYARQALYEAAGRKHYKVIIRSAKQEEARKKDVRVATLTGRLRHKRGPGNGSNRGSRERSDESQVNP